MSKINSHKDLKVWQESMDFVVEIYKLLEQFPDEEKFILTNKIKRAAISIPSNIAEGAGRESNQEFFRFLSISQGSLSELETQLEIAEKLKYITLNDEIKKQIIFIRIMLTHLKKSLINKK